MHMMLLKLLSTQQYKKPSRLKKRKLSIYLLNKLKPLIIFRFVSVILIRFKYDDSSMSMVESNQDDNQLVKAKKKIIISNWNEYEEKTILEMLKSTQVFCNLMNLRYVMITMCPICFFMVFFRLRSARL